MKKKKQRGFSLIEILAVVAVILILATVVMAHFRTVSRSARNVVIHDLLRDCRGAYLRLSYGSAPGYSPNTNVARLKDFVAATTLGEAEVKAAGGSLQVTGLPENLFRDHRTSLVLDYQRNTFDGDNEAGFLAKVLW